MPENVGQFFTWIGSAAAFALVMSLVLEKLPGWAKLNSDLKSFISMAVAVALGLFSAALVKWVPAGVQADLEPWYERIMAALVIWGGSQYFHWYIDVRPNTPTITAQLINMTAGAAPNTSPIEGSTTSLLPPAPPAAPPPILLKPEESAKAGG